MKARKEYFNETLCHSWKEWPSKGHVIFLFYKGSQKNVLGMLEMIQRELRIYIVNSGVEFWPRLYALALPKDILWTCAQRCKPWLCTVQRAGILGITETQANTDKLLRKENREQVRLEDRASRIQEICVHPSGLRHSGVAIFKPTEIFHSLVCPSPLGDTSRHGINICHNSVMKGSWYRFRWKFPGEKKNPTKSFTSSWFHFTLQQQKVAHLHSRRWKTGTGILSDATAPTLQTEQPQW